MDGTDWVDGCQFVQDAFSSNPWKKPLPPKHRGHDRTSNPSKKVLVWRILQLPCHESKLQDYALVGATGSAHCPTNT
jgi:hypothetical protein